MNTLLRTEAQSSYINTLRNEGVFVFKKFISTEKIQILINEINQIREIVLQKVSTMDRPLKTYSDIAERHLGRLDYRCGFTAEIFNQVAAPIIKVIQETSQQIDFNHYWGVVTSLPGSGPTNWHRDVYPILNTSEGVNLSYLDLDLPPYYFTVLIPLVEITQENGPTAFIKHSHHHAIIDETKEEIYAPLVSPGDITIFEGRLMHKGMENNSNQERLVAYITFIANWYHDQTFTVNNYLFPELARFPC